jgi:hypothetical protein
MVSPRPSCISAPVSMIDSPPSWRMPTSNETRVRVDGRSKIIASVLPSSGLRTIAPLAAFRSFFMAALTSSIVRRSPAGNALMSRKCRSGFTIRPLPSSATR